MPYVIIIGPREQPTTIILGRLEETFVDIKIGYKILFRIKVKVIVVMHNGILGELTPKTYQLIITALKQALKLGQAEMVRFELIDINSGLAKSIHGEITTLCREHFIIPQTHWKMSIPEKIDNIYSNISKYHRNKLRRMVKRLEGDFSSEFIKIHCFQSTFELEKMFLDVEKIAKKTYQRVLGVGFIDNHENRSRLMLEASKGWLRMYVLYLNDSPRAYWWGLLYGKKFYSCAMGYDSEFYKYSLGTYILIKVLETLVYQGIKELDFGPGDALYKQQFGNNSYNEASFNIFAPTLRATTLNLLLTLNNGITIIARKVLTRFKLVELLKKHWRKRLRHRVPNE